MQVAPILAPGVPPDYYRRIYEAEERHFWYVGMRSISAALVGPVLTRPGQRVLDAGCGTGGFLRWVLDRGSFASAAGVDVSSAAIEYARHRVPEADLHCSSLSSLPFADESFELVVCNDVLQHVAEEQVDASLRELGRVLVPGAMLLLRTNGARRLWRDRADWRAYDRATLAGQLRRAGLFCRRLTHANMVLSAYGEVRGRRPRAPSPDHDGIPHRSPGRLVNAIGAALLTAEARWLARPGATLPFGHTLFAIAEAPA